MLSNFRNSPVGSYLSSFDWPLPLPFRIHNKTFSRSFDLSLGERRVTGANPTGSNASSSPLSLNPSTPSPRNQAMASSISLALISSGVRFSIATFLNSSRASSSTSETRPLFLIQKRAVTMSLALCCLD